MDAGSAWAIEAVKAAGWKTGANTDRWAADLVVGAEDAGSTCSVTDSDEATSSGADTWAAGLDAGTKGPESPSSVYGWAVGWNVGAENADELGCIRF